jgi:hypothetical protein
MTITQLSAPVGGGVAVAMCHVWMCFTAHADASNAVSPSATVRPAAANVEVLFGRAAEPNTAVLTPRSLPHTESRIGR